MPKTKDNNLIINYVQNKKKHHLKGGSLKNNDLDEIKSNQLQISQCYNCKFYNIDNNNYKEFAVKKLIDLFAKLEELKKKSGRERLLNYSLWYVAIITTIGIILIIVQGFNIATFKLNTSFFIMSLLSITSTVLYTLKLISKYLFENEKDKILQVVEKVLNNQIK